MVENGKFVIEDNALLNRRENATFRAIKTELNAMLDEIEEKVSELVISGDKIDDAKITEITNLLKKIDIQIMNNAAVKKLLASNDAVFKAEIDGIISGIIEAVQYRIDEGSGYLEEEELSDEDVEKIQSAVRQSINKTKTFEAKNKIDEFNARGNETIVAQIATEVTEIESKKTKLENQRKGFDEYKKLRVQVPDNDVEKEVWQIKNEYDQYIDRKQKLTALERYNTTGLSQLSVSCKDPSKGLPNNDAKRVKKFFDVLKLLAGTELGNQEVEVNGEKVKLSELADKKYVEIPDSKGPITVDKAALATIFKSIRIDKIKADLPNAIIDAQNKNKENFEKKLDGFKTLEKFSKLRNALLGDNATEIEDCFDKTLTVVTTFEDFISNPDKVTELEDEITKLEQRYSRLAQIRDSGYDGSKLTRPTELTDEEKRRIQLSEFGIDFEHTEELSKLKGRELDDKIDELRSDVLEHMEYDDIEEKFSDTERRKIDDALDLVPKPAQRWYHKVLQTAIRFVTRNKDYEYIPQRRVYEARLQSAREQEVDSLLNRRIRGAIEGRVEVAERREEEIARYNELQPHEKFIEGIRVATPKVILSRPGEAVDKSVMAAMDDRIDEEKKKGTPTPSPDLDEIDI